MKTVGDLITELQKYDPSTRLSFSVWGAEWIDQEKLNNWFKSEYPDISDGVSAGDFAVHPEVCTVKVSKIVAVGQGFDGLSVGDQFVAINLR